MTTQLFALGRRATSITIAGALTLSILAMAPAGAHARGVETRTPLHEGAGMTGRPDARALAVQRTLLRRGYDLGASGADGRFGSLTAAAVRRFQARAGLAVDGIVGVRTARALEAPSSVALREGVGMRTRPSERVHRLQRTLMRSGFDVGPPGADGRFGPLTAAAVRRMQHARRLTADGVVGPRTRHVVRLLAGDRRPRRTAVDRPASRDRSVQLADDRPRTPATAGSTRPQRTTDTARWTFLSALAALCAGAALAVQLVARRRRKGAATVVPIQRDVYLQAGCSDDDSGAIRGFAIAAALAPGARAEDDDAIVRWLVDDHRRPAPVWVAAEDVRRPASGLPVGERVIGYVAYDALVDDDQRQWAIQGVEDVCAARGWELQLVVDEDTRTSLLDRPGLRHAVREISAGHARALVMSDSRSLANPLRDIAMLLERLREAEAGLVVADLDLDTTTPPGRGTASTLTALGDRERERSRAPGAVRTPADRAGERGRTEP